MFRRGWVMAAESDAEAARNGIIPIVVFWGLTLYGFQNFLPSSKKNNKILIFQNRFCPNSLLLGFSMFLSQRVCLDWTAVSASLGLSFSCFWPCPPCFPNVLRCCVRLLGLVSQLVRGLVYQLASHLLFQLN